MSSRLKPTGFKRAFLRESFDVLSASPLVIRWRTRPLAHFKDERVWKIWNRGNAGQVIRASADGRMRLKINGPDGVSRILDAKAIIAEIGVTPIGDQQSIHDGLPTDKFGETREIAGTGRLAAVMQAAVDETGRLRDDLMVMSSQIDPYRLDTPARHRDAQWFAAQVERFVSLGRNIHPRGVFYACVSAGDVVKPDGEAFENNADNEAFISESSKLARWLGYVPFERLIDNKNDKPIVRLAPSSDAPTAQVWADDLDIVELDADALGVAAGLADFKPRQPNRLVFFGEKTSLDDVLAPLAEEEFSADLYLMSGHISDTYLHQMARDAVADGRPLVVFTFSDFDPAGYWDMPTAIGRKLQALRDLLFPELEFTVVHAALGPDQVRDLDLPSSPLKEGEKRAAKWLELYGSEQTEIDALATLNPDALRDIARAAIAPYFDADLAERVRAAEAAWQEIANAEIADQIDEDRLDRLKARAEAALAELREVNTELDSMAEEIEVSDAPGLPEPDMEALEEAQAERRDAVLIDSDMDYVEATDRLNAHNEKAARRGS